jgi:hypothetical protein
MPGTPAQSSSKPFFRNTARSIHDVCLELISRRSVRVEEEEEAEEEEEEDHDSGILGDFVPLCYLARYALYSPPLCLRQPLPIIGLLEFPSKLLRRFLRGFVVATAHGLVTAPASVCVAPRDNRFWRNRIFARVMSGFVVVPVQAAAAARIDYLDNNGVSYSVLYGDFADVLSYLIADANCVNERSRLDCAAVLPHL